ncbi:type I restriction endonuclease subunit R [uncultured Methanosphaera sp.]|uniref:type I restriction endonuclease subunit R n=1 Tax=uncultured Methanosphaera sp. TaxID=262501 RepID=UPI000DC41185|nr:type I restriction endonuclease subunit R [uncultured Methanosphaera sp.]RAP45705.1 MAG: restriction endonuclease subunit R [Methanosphaera sp. SHI1033]
MSHQSEQALEDEFISQLESLDYEYVDIRDISQLKDNLKVQLEILNNTKFSEQEFNKILLHLESGGIFDKAKKLRDKMELLRDDNTMDYIDFFNYHWCKNSFQVAHQITMEGKYKNRYDVTILINGLPLVQVELKRRGIELKRAFNQTQRYQIHTYRGLFQYIQVFVISNGVDTKYYANNRDLNYKFTFFWKDEKNNNISNLKDFTNEFLERYHIHKMIDKYIVLSESTRSMVILRAYQFYAVEKILDSALHSKKNGYIWHATGSGKTLTSFKASQLLARKAEIDKVLFIVDRKDLDNQTFNEFNKFSNGSVDSTENTKKLIQQLRGTDKLIVTTIQKLSKAAKSNKKELESVKDQKMILMFDECHRSQFGEMHNTITNYFTNIQCFGFTGTPIFAENSNKNKTTHDIFGDRLHQYLIKDAIKDNNVLGFSVEYIGRYKNKSKYDIAVEEINTKEVMESDKRLEKIVDYIFENHDRKTYNREFTSIFAVSSIKVLNRYYEIFKKKNQELPEEDRLKIATIYTYDDNPDLTEEEVHPRDTLEEQISDYNNLFGTNYSTDTFSMYYQDVSEKSKAKKIDILLVVNMFLTGFDNKYLNSLYVDKNLVYHSLIQAYSRTNRICNEKKAYGNIICFRNLKKQTDDAIRLFSDENAEETVLMKPYREYVENFNSGVKTLHTIVKTVDEVDQLEGEDLKNFVKTFRDLLRLLNRITTFTEFNYKDLSLPEQEIEDYKSKYIDIYDPPTSIGEKESVLEDIDFEIELLRRDDINVEYILKLLKELQPNTPGFEKDKQFILNTMEKDIKLRSKIDLINKFIEENIVKPNENVNTEEKLEEYMDREKKTAINQLITSENLHQDKTKNLINEYEFSGKIKPMEVANLFTEKLKLKDKRRKRQELKQEIMDLIDKYTW